MHPRYRGAEYKLHHGVIVKAVVWNADFEEIGAPVEFDERPSRWVEGDAASNREAVSHVYVIKAEAADLGDDALPELRSIVMIQDLPPIVSASRALRHRRLLEQAP